MSNSDMETNFPELLKEMQSLLNPEMDRFISQREVYHGVVSTRNTLESKRYLGKITVQDEIDYKAASQAVEEADVTLRQLEKKLQSKAHKSGWYKKTDAFVSLGHLQVYIISRQAHNR